MSVIVIGVTAFAGAWAAVAGALTILTPLLAGIGISIGAIAWPVTLVVAGITALGVAWTSNFLGIKDITYSVFDWLKSAWTVVCDNLDLIGTVILGLMNPIAGLYMAWSNNLFGIKDITTNVFNSIKDFFTNINWFELGSNILSTMTDGIKSVINKPYEAVKSVFSKVSNLFSNSDAKEGPLSTLTMNGRNILSTMAIGVKQEAPEFEKTIQQSLMFSTPEYTDKQPVKTSEDKQIVYTFHIDRIHLPGVSDAQTFIDDISNFVRAHAVNI